VVAILAIDGMLLVAVAHRYPMRWDLSATRSNMLEPDTVALLASVDEPVSVIVVRPEIEQFEPVYAEVDRVLDRMQTHSRHLRRESIDPLSDVSRASVLAHELALSPRDLTDAGTVVFARGERRQGIDLLDLASFGRDSLGVGAATRIDAEGQLATALARVMADETQTVCMTSGHGEATIAGADASAEQASWSSVANRLGRRGLRVDDIGAVGTEIPIGCRVVVVAGPSVPLEPDAALALGRWLASGGRLLVAANDRPIDGARGLTLPETGLEMILARFGVSLPASVVVDPGGEVGLPLSWATVSGYGDHPAVSAFRDRRLTVWRHPRAVALGPSEGETTASVLVKGSPLAWAESDLSALYAGDDVNADADELAGANAIAVAVREASSGARLVVVGSVVSPSQELAGRGVGAADALVANAIAWLASEQATQVAVEVPTKSPEYLRLIMSPGQRHRVFALCVVVLPLLAAGIGGLLYWRRRRG